jgi:hypothetical protein
MIKIIIAAIFFCNLQATDNPDSMNPAAFAAAQAKIGQFLSQSWVQAVQSSTGQKTAKKAARTLPRQLPRELRKKRTPQKKK